MNNTCNSILFVFAILAGLFLQSCKPKEVYQYDKYGMQRMAGAHTFRANVLNHYHFNGYVRDSVYATNDTSIIIAVLNKDIVEVAGTRMYIVDEYPTTSELIFVNDTGAYCGPACHKVVLNYNYSANSVSLTDGVYNINSADDVVMTYTAVN